MTIQLLKIAAQIIFLDRQIYLNTRNLKIIAYHQENYKNKHDALFSNKLRLPTGEIHVWHTASSVMSFVLPWSRDSSWIRDVALCLKLPLTPFIVWANRKALPMWQVPFSHDSAHIYFTFYGICVLICSGNRSFYLTWIYKFKNHR